eukprot:Colp12_sorted_trinity150504_noHs@11224
MANLEEKLGVVEMTMPWGVWHQTIEDVTLFVNVPKGTKGKDLSVVVKPKSICVKLKPMPSTVFLEGELTGTVVADETVWTIEDNAVRIELQKARRDAKSSWPTILVGEEISDPLAAENMQRKITLERLQRENPGFDFSGADISGNYQNGGPQLPDL